MRSLIIFAALAAPLLTAVAFPPTALADFVVTGQTPEVTPVDSADTPNATSAAPDGAPTYNAETSPSPSPVRMPRTARWKMAYGFGNRIPLSFAVRQIVPHTIKVSYGPGASPYALVDWKGGSTWNRVLGDAVKPLGLRLVMTYMAVEIRK